MMSEQAPSTDQLVQQAFGLLLEIRSHSNARHLLTLGVGFLKVLALRRATEDPPLVVSVRAVQIR